MKKWPSFVIGLCFCALVFGALTWKLNTSSGITTTEEYYQKVRNGLAEINIPTSNNTNSINAASDSLSNFIYYRAGVQISDVNKNLLRSAEQNAWNDSKRVDAANLIQIITDIAIEKIPALTNSDIVGITDSSRGFSHPNLPNGFQMGRLKVKLRASGYGRMPADEFSAELGRLRDGGILSKVAQNLIYVSVTNEVNRRVDTLRNADPQFFGGTKSSMTPTQALLITYAVIADDSLAHNQAGLTQNMQTAQELNSRTSGGNFPSSEGYRAYGDNGYIHSSPTSILFSDASVSRLLTLIQERGK